MFTTSTQAGASRRPRPSGVRRSQSRATSIAGLAETETPPPTAGPSTRTRPTRAASARRASILNGPATRTPLRTTSRAASALINDLGVDDADAVLLIDEDGGSEGLNADQGILFHSETHAVSILGGKHGNCIPAEVVETLARSDFYSEPHLAVLDTDRGYACLAGRRQCHVWSLASIYDGQRSIATAPTCYTFPMPEPSTMSLAATVFSPVPFTAFISLDDRSSSYAREPGFLAITAVGQAVYWDSVSAALSDVEDYSREDLPLVQGEVIRALERLSPTLFVAATSGSRVFSLQVHTSYTSPKAGLSVHLASKSRGVLARMGGLFGGASIDPRGGVSAVSVCCDEPTKQGQAAWIARCLSQNSLQTWRFLDTHEEFVGEMDVTHIVGQALVDYGSVQSAPPEFEIADIRATSPAEVTLLVSYTAQTAGMRKQLAYSLVTLTGEDVTAVKPLSFTHEPDPRPLSGPRLHGSPNGDFLYVVFPDVAIISSLDPSLAFEESVSLKQTVKDRFLGTGNLAPASLLALTAHTGLLRIDIETDRIRALAKNSRGMDPQDLATKNLQTKLEQAVFFADNSKNPLAFDLTLTNDMGDLVSAAESISRSIITSTSPHLQTIIDLRVQIADRSARLKHLIRFIHDNNLMGRLSKTARRRLAWDAEKLAVAASLWQARNASISSHLENDSVLIEAIENLNLSSRAGEDIVRSFLRMHVSHLPELLQQLLPILQRRVAPTEIALDERVSALQQIDKILCLSMQATSRHRIEQNGMYGIPQGPDSQVCLAEPWLSQANILQLLRTAFESTDMILQERIQTLGTNIDAESGPTQPSSKSRNFTAAGVNKNVDLSREREIQRTLKASLVDLADDTLAMFQERMSYLQSIGDEPAAVHELRSLLETYVTLRPKIINCMVRYSRTNAAFDLAERYRDFRSLVVMCHDASGSSAAKLAFYMDKYKEEFAFALYDWYRESGRSHEIVTQDAAYAPLVLKYLKTKNILELAWMQEIAMHDIRAACKDLMQRSTQEVMLEGQKLTLSLGKLASVSMFSREQVQKSPAAQQALSAIDDRLDLVAAQERLKSLCQTIQDVGDRHKPLELQATIVSGRLCSYLTHPELIKLASLLFLRIINGEALGPEDVVDVLSLKDNEDDEQKQDSAYALRVLARDRGLPVARVELASKTIWRRIYLRDDWIALRRQGLTSSDDAFSDAIRSTALYTALRVCGRAAEEGVAILAPLECLYDSSPEEDACVAARFSSERSSGFVDFSALAAEYARESHMLRELCSDEMVRLGDIYEEVQRLVQLDSSAVGETLGAEDSIMGL